MLGPMVVCLVALLFLKFHSAQSQNVDEHSSTELYYDYDSMEKEFGRKMEIPATALKIVANETEEWQKSNQTDDTKAPFKKEVVHPMGKGEGVRDRKMPEGEELKRDENTNTTIEPSMAEETSDEDSKTTILFSGFYTPADDSGSDETTTIFTEEPPTTTILPVTEPTRHAKSTTTVRTTTTMKTTTTSHPQVLPELDQPAESPSYHELEQERYLRSKHPCSRECIEGSPPMSCSYTFSVEWYHSMSKACYNCPFNISDCYRPDCVPTDGVKRPIMVINRSIPGPAIEVCQGDKITVDVVNNLMEESTTIHWHGHHQRGSPYMDGVPFVTQCPIPPKSSFRYTYIASTPGTHFWHSHSGCQRADGAFGAFIVRKPLSQDFHRDLYDLDLPEHTIVTLDWSHQLGVALFTSHHHAGGDNKPRTLQVNGRGIYQPFSYRGRLIYTPPASFTVTKGFRYRFRLINAGVLNCPIALSVDNHTMTVISTDGSDVHSVYVDTLVSYAGERWDFILNADAEAGNYWMRFRGLMDCDERFTSAHQAAVLRYQGSDPQQKPRGEVTYEEAKREGIVVNQLNVPLNDPSISIPELAAVSTETDQSLRRIPDRKLIVSYDFHPLDNPVLHKPQKYGFHQVLHKAERIYTPQFNHITLKLPPFPLLSQPYDIRPNMLCNNHDLSRCNETFCECTNIIELKLGEVVEMILIDIGVTYDANHPFHLHGHPFRVVAMDRIGKNVTVEKILEMDNAGLIERNLHSPPVKDTVTVPDGGYTILRFQATNPGFWIFHCHIEFHVELGMALLFKVGDESEFPPVPKGFPKCGNFLPSSDNLPSIRENEIDFGEGLLSYNVTGESDNDESNFVPFEHLWPLISKLNKRNSATSTDSFPLLIAGLITKFFLNIFYNKIL